MIPATSPINDLKVSTTPKIGSMVVFRPWGKTLDSIDFWRRWATVGRWFSLQEEPDRHLVGRVVAIKRVGDGFYYRVTSGTTGWDAAPVDVRLCPVDYYTS